MGVFMNFRKIKYFIIALFVFISSVLTPYTEVMAFDIPTAFWGVLESGRAMFTAMTAGGAYKNGIDISSFERSSRQDFHDFQTQILIGYQALHMSEENAKTLVPITLIFCASLLTGLGVFDDIAKFAGAGTLVPITGFANAVASPAIDDKSEGLVMGVGAQMFTIAGPVIVYGVLSSVLYGAIYWLCEVVL